MADNRVEVRWEVEDGYAGGSRPQRFRINMSEMAESCETEQQARDYLCDEVDQEMRNKISASIRNEDEVIAAWRKARIIRESGREQE